GRLGEWMDAAVDVGPQLAVVAGHGVDVRARLGRGRGAVQPGDGHAVELALLQRKVGLHGFTSRYFPDPSGTMADSFRGNIFICNNSETAAAARVPSLPTTRNSVWSSCQAVIAGSLSSTRS